MKNCLLLIIAFFGLNALYAQTTVSGKVTDNLNNPLMGVDLMVKGTFSGTSTDFDGNFTLRTEEATPFTLVISSIGYQTQEIRISGSQSDLHITLDSDNSILDEVVVTASRTEERLMESPVTIEKLDAQTIRASSSIDYFNEMTKLKGVTTASGSMNFNAVNTRGFGGIANTRFVQLVDGIDNSAPLLNFPLGNLIGISETDIKDIELVPGAASALYGPNAFNGIMMMTSKTPWDHRGLTVTMRSGITKASNDKANPQFLADVRYAETFGKFGIKVTGSYLGAKDWLADDYRTDVVTQQTYKQGHGVDPNTGQLIVGDRPLNFDGVNTYGDENILSTVPLGILQGISPETAQGIMYGVASNPDFNILFGGDVNAALDFIGSNFQYLPTVDIRRTGLTEEQLLDNRKATSMKGTLGLYYELTDDIMLNYDFRIGSGNSVYQGSERYALRNFSSFSNKLEATGKNFLFRTYMTQTNAGDSYNMTALGSYTNELLYGTAAFGDQPGWAGVYLGNFVAQLMGGARLSGLPLNQLLAANPDLIMGAHAGARLSADAMMHQPGTPEFQNAVETIRKTLFQHADPENQILGGAGFKDNSRLFHTEGTYDFSSLLDDEVGVMVGANHRMYSLSTSGTIFNEDPDGIGKNDRININEFGAFLQLSKQLLDDHLKVAASLRYDKNENFKGIFSPRISMVGTFGEKRQHNIRASFQTGFRNPDTQAQYIYFPASTILLGGTKANAERYGIYEGGAYTAESFNNFRNSVLAGAPDLTLLEEFYMDYISPEKLSTFELGFKTLIEDLYIDWNFYYTWYKDFITQANVVAKEGTSQKGQPIPGVAEFLATGGLATPGIFRPYHNVPGTVESWGSAIGLTYRLPDGYRLRANYNYMDFSAKDKSREATLDFNSPKNMFNMGFSNANISRSGAGFDVSYRWQSGFDWVSSFGSGYVKAFNTLDAAVFYKVEDWNTTFKLAGTNLVGPSYRTNIGGPYIGKIITVGLTFDTGL